MQLADREGFLIIDEIPAVSLQFDSDENMAERLRMCLQQIEELIVRDKNHPSVVMWSVANEPMPPNSMARRSGEDTRPSRPRDEAGFSDPDAPRPAARRDAPGHPGGRHGRPERMARAQLT